MNKHILFLSLIAGGFFFDTVCARQKNKEVLNEALQDKVERKKSLARLERSRDRVEFWKEVIAGLKDRGVTKNAHFIKRAEFGLKRAERILSTLEAAQKASVLSAQAPKELKEKTETQTKGKVLAHHGA